MGESETLGDAAAETAERVLLGKWAREFRTPLLRFFQKRAPSFAEPDDLVQEVFMRLAQRANLADIRHIDGYLFQTAASVLADRYRRDQRQPQTVESFEEAVHGEAVLAPERVLMGRQSLDLLIEGLYALPQLTRNIFVLYHFENVRQTEIATRLRIPVSTIEKHMARANRQLLKRLQGNHER